MLVELRKATPSAYPSPVFNAKSALKTRLRYARELTTLLRSVIKKKEGHLR